MAQEGVGCVDGNSNEGLGEQIEQEEQGEEQEEEGKEREEGNWREKGGKLGLLYHTLFIC